MDELQYTPPLAFPKSRRQKRGGVKFKDPPLALIVSQWCFDVSEHIFNIILGVKWFFRARSVRKSKIFAKK